MMRKKIEINQTYEEDRSLIKELLDIMYVFKLDYTNTFIDIQDQNIEKYECMKNWNLKLKKRKKLNKNEEKNININPYIIPRNHIINKILDESDNDNFKNLHEMLGILKNPYRHLVPERYTQAPKEEEKIHQTFCGT